MPEAQHMETGFKQPYGEFQLKGWRLRWAMLKFRALLLPQKALCLVGRHAETSWVMYENDEGFVVREGECSACHDVVSRTTYDLPG